MKRENKNKDRGSMKLIQYYFFLFRFEQMSNNVSKSTQAHKFSYRANMNVELKLEFSEFPKKKRRVFRDAY